MSRRKRRLSPTSGPRQAAPSRPVPSPRLSLHPDVGGGIRGGVPLTLDEVRRLYGPARTLGAGEKERMALDNQLAADGVYTLLQHTFELGQGAAPQFMGYGALQNMAQNGLLRACIETVADDMTREWITLRGGSDTPSEDAGEGAADAADRLKALDEAQRRHNLQSVFHEAAELVGYEGGAFIFIDTGADGEALMTPLHRGPWGAELRPDRPLRFQVVDPVNVFPGDYNSTSPLRHDYFRPRWWWVLGERVHKSRLLRLVANEVPVLLRPAYNFMGLPQAQILWDYILHFQECRAAEARLLTKFSLTVFQTNMESELQQGAAWADLDRRVSQLVRYRSNDGVLLIDKDTENVIKLETPLSGVTDIVRQALEFLAALNRTPAVKLLGISPSGFNATGESDIRNYYDHITSQQEKVLRPAIQRALECIQLHEFSEIDHGLGFDFAPLGEEDRAALATQQKTRADTVAVYLDRGVISADEARAALAKDPDSPFADIDPEELPEEPGEAGEVPPGMEDEPGELGELGDVDDVDKAGAVYDAALDADRWITVHPNGKENTGQPVLIDDETGEVKAGMGGKFNGHNMGSVGKQRGKASKIRSGGASSGAPNPQQSGGRDVVVQPEVIDPAKSVKDEEAHFASQALLRDDEINALNLYSSNDGNPPPYRAINQVLRGKGELDEKNMDAVRCMDNAFKRAKTFKQILSYRGVKNAALFEDMKVGDKFIDKGFTSVSTDQRTAKSFVGKEGVFLEVIVPKGSRAISMIDSFGLKSEYPEEKEILLDRGGSYTVKNIRNENGHKTITVVYNDREEE